MAEGDEREPLLTDDIRELLRLVNQGDISEVLIRRGDAKVHIKRGIAQQSIVPMASSIASHDVPTGGYITQMPSVECTTHTVTRRGADDRHHDHCTDGWYLLWLAFAEGCPICPCRRRSATGRCAWHHRSHEDHERDRVRDSGIYQRNSGREWSSSRVWSGTDGDRAGIVFSVAVRL